MKFLVLVSLLLFAPAGLSFAKGPKQVVVSIFSLAKNANISTDRKLQNKVNAMVSFDLMADKILRGFKGAQQNKKWFTGLLREIITRSVYPESPGFLKGVKITYKKSKINGSTALIRSEIFREGETSEVDYSLKKIGGRWKVVDVSLDEESWADITREQVDAVLQNSNWDELRKKMQKRLNDIREEQNKSKKAGA